MRIPLMLFFVLCSYTGLCQETAFVVIDVAGAVTYGQNKKAMIGTNIVNNETIIVGKASAVTLACRNSGYARFSSPGKYVANTTTYCRAAADAAFANLCKFAWRQFAHKESADEWRDHLDNMGAASRGAACFANVDPNITDVYYWQGDFVLSCKPLTPGTALYLKIYKDANSAPFLQAPLANNKYTLSMLKGKLQEDMDYYWNVTTKDGFCGEMYHLHILNKHGHDSIVNLQTNAISTYITNKAERQYLLGVLLENQHLFADALTCYKEAVKLSPAEKRYSHEVITFKKRYNMN